MTGQETSMSLAGKWISAQGKRSRPRRKRHHEERTGWNGFRESHRQTDRQMDEQTVERTDKRTDRRVKSGTQARAHVERSGK